MYLNPFESIHQGAFDLSKLAMPLRDGRDPTNLNGEEVTFHIPAMAFSNKRLREIFPNLSDAQGNSLLTRFKSELADYFGRSHSIAELKDRTGVLSGSSMLVSAGFSNSLDGLLDAIAVRYALMSILEVDREILSRIVDRKVEFKIDPAGKNLKVFPIRHGIHEPSLELSGDLFGDCFKKRSWLLVPKFAHLTFISVVQDIQEELGRLQPQVQETFGAFYSAYQKLY